MIRLVVKQNNSTINEFKFTESPVSIGRETTSNVFLADRAVSKKHAQLFTTEDSKWMVEDLKARNKTYLNGQPIKKVAIKTGDCIAIADFAIEIHLEDDTDTVQTAHPADTIQLEATLATPSHEILIRKPDASHAPAMRLAAKRLSDFSQATETISEVSNLEELLSALLDVTLKQFSAYHCWCAMREQPTGPMTYHTGKRRDGKAVEFDEINLNQKINEAVDKGQSMVLPRVSAQIEEKERIRSALIASITRHQGCFGIIYIDNAMIQEHYSLSDLDYLMLLAIHTASVLKRLLS